MTSGRLYWVTGIGWYSIFITAAMFYVSNVSRGVFHWVSFSFLCLWLLFIVYRAYRWNGAPWRRIHYRGMFLYAHMAGKEAGLAAIEKREFDVLNACRQLLYAFIANHEYETANEMIRVIDEERGNLYVNIIDEYVRHFYPNANEVEIHNLLVALSQEDKVNPRMALACLILNKYGQKEAAKYVMAVVKGEAN